MKRKEKSSPKKPREVGLAFKVAKDSKVDGFRISPDGHFELMYKGKPVELSYAAAEVSYAREKKRKVVYRAEVDPKRPRVNIHHRMTGFDELFAIDTNTFELNGIKVSAASYLKVKFTIEGRLTKIDLPFQEVMEYRNLKVDEPEKFAWRSLCVGICQHEDYKKESKIGMIVDSSLGDLEAINARTQPIHGKYFLPENFTLIYATSDVGTDTIANWLLKKCDSNAEKVKKLIQEKWVSETLKETPPGSLFSHYRPWFYEDGQIDGKPYDPIEIGWS